MFHSICPECGREIASTVRECPVCDGPEEAELVPAGVVEASASTPTPAASAGSPATSGAPLITAHAMDRVPAIADSSKEDAVAQTLPMERQAQAEIVSRPAQTETALSDTLRTVLESTKAPLSIALLEDVADLQALASEPVQWRRKNGHAASGATQNGASEAHADVPAQNAAEAATPEAGTPIDAREAMKLLAAPVAIPQPEPSAAVPTAALIAEPLNPEQAQNAAASLQNLSSGIAGIALTESATPAEAEAAPETEVSSNVEPEAGAPAEIRESESQLVAEKISEPAAEPAALIPEILDAKAAAEKSIELRAADLLARLNTGRDEAERVAKSIRTKTVESRAVETHSVENRAIETHALNSKTLNGTTSAGISLEAKPVEAKQVEAKPVETKAEAVIQAASVIETPLANDAAATEMRDVPREAQTPAAPVVREVQPASAIVAEPQKASPKVGKFGRLLRMASESHKPVTGSSSSPVKETALAAADQGSPAAAVIQAPLHSQVTPVAPNQGEPAATNQTAPAQANAEPPNVDAPQSRARIRLDAPVVDAAPAPPAGIPVAPFEATSRQLPLPLSLAPVSPATAAVLPKGRRTSHEEPIAAPTDFGNVPFSENAPLLTNKLRQPPPEPALVDKKLPIPQPAAMDMAASFAPPVAIPPSAGSVRPPRSQIGGPAPRYGRLVRNPSVGKSAMRPVAPPHEAIKAETAPSLSLPGPMLTPSLVAFRDKELMLRVVGFGAQRKRWGNAWLAVAVLVGSGLGVGLIGFFTNMPRPEPSFKDAAKDAPVAAAVAAAATPAPAAPAPAKPATHPIAKSIELSGIRIVGDPSGGEQVRFTVVNHGPTRFTDGVVYVALHSANARPGQMPIYRFTFPAPNLGPYESREMSSIAKKVADDGSLPGWQDLRAEIEVGQP